MSVGVRFYLGDYLVSTEPTDTTTYAEILGQTVLIEAHELLDRAKLIGQTLRDRTVDVVGESNLTRQELLDANASTSAQPTSTVPKLAD
jgi:hypothetical protein